MSPPRASSVTLQSWRAATRSRLGAGGGPLRLRGLPWESSEVEDELASDCFRRVSGRESVDVRGEVE